MYEHRDDIRSARRAVDLQHHRERKPAETARRACREHGLAVFVNFKVEPLEQKHARRRYAYRRARLERKILAYKKEREYEQRRVDDKRRPARGKSGLILDHCRDTGRAARRKVVRQREHLDAHRSDKSRKQNDKRNDDKIIEPFILEDRQRHSNFLSRAFTAYCNIKQRQNQVFATTFRIDKLSSRSFFRAERCLPAESLRPHACGYVFITAGKKIGPKVRKLSDRHGCVY